MASDVTVKQPPLNPCCVLWKDKCSKLVEGRSCLRRAVKILEEQVDKVQAENVSLKKVCEEERVRAEKEEEEKEIEFAMRVSLEKEVSELKSQVLLLHEKGSASEKGEVNVLHHGILEGEKEISWLKELLEKEKVRADNQKKITQVQKKNATDAWKHVKSEKDKADEERRLANVERKRVEELQVEVESLKKELARRVSSEGEVASLKAKLLLLQQKGSADADRSKEVKLLQGRISRAEKEINQLKDLLEKEKLRTDNEKKNAETARKSADEARKHAEAEKHRAHEERKRASSEAKKAEEFQLQWENMKMSHAVHEEDIGKIEELTKQVNELLCSRTAAQASAVLPNKNNKEDSIKVKHLLKELKLEKARVKHAKRVAKFEESRNRIIQQEFSRLKMDFVQISGRLDALSGCFSASNEGIEVVKKVANMKISKNRNICNLESFHSYPWDAIELSKPKSMALANNCSTGKNHHLTIPSCGLNCAENISGTDSKMESLLGGFNQKMLKSSAINSHSGSFSDGQFVGSQERAALFTTSDKLKEENLNSQSAVSSMSVEVNKGELNEKHAIVAENSIRSPHIVDVVGRVDRHDRKRRLVDAIESVDSLYSEGKRLHKQMEEKLSALHGLLNKGSDKLDLEDPESVEPNAQDICYAKHDKIDEKIKLPGEENAIMHHFSGKSDPGMTTKIGNKVAHAQNDGVQDSSPDNNLMQIQEAGRECTTNPSESGLETLGSFEKIANKDLMKLLDLDDAADEEYYRSAVEVPMSPNLPDIRLSTEVEMLDMDKFAPSVDESFAIEKNTVVSNTSEQNPSGTCCHELQQGDEDLTNSFYALDCRNGLHGTLDVTKGADGHSGDSRIEAKKLNLSISVYDSLKLAHESDLNYMHCRTPPYCVVSSDSNDSGSISRVFYAMRICMSHCSLDTSTEYLVHSLLRTLKMEETASPKEKACAFFSMLLLNFTMCMLGMFGSHSDGDFFACLDYFAGQIHTALSGSESRSLFVELFCLDELIDLIGNFLVNGRIMVHTSESSGTSSECGPRINILLDGVNIDLSSREALACQLVAGSVILGSLGAAMDQIGLICEASFNLLLMLKRDTSIVLSMLHIFAYLAGEKFFSMKEYGLEMTVLKSIVTSLEGKSPSNSSASSHLSPADQNTVEFQSCVNCPFSMDVVSIDTVASVLLGRLDGFVLSHQNVVESTEFSYSSFMYTNDKASNISCPDEVLSERPVAQSSSSVDDSLVDLSDILSLVELLACNMGWDWTCSKIIPKLQELLKRPVLDNVATAVIILLGQLGRLGVTACAYEDKAIDDLRCSFSSFLQRDTTVKAAFPVQVATVNALLGLLTLDFKNVVQADVDLPASSSQTVSIDIIRKWFDLLTKEQQALSFSLLEYSG